MPRQVELNEGSRPGSARELRQHLLNASNELYLHEQRCLRSGRPLPEALRRAHAAVRAELRRIEREAEADARSASREP
jgi:hypothetical protein